jgi:hypothetical protein
VAAGATVGAVRAAAMRVSLNVFQAPQSGHCPAHLTLCAPHAEHK